MYCLMTAKTLCQCGFPDSSYFATRTTTVSYDPNGNVLTTTDAKGKVQSTIVYNSSNQAVSTTDAAGNTTTSRVRSGGQAAHQRLMHCLTIRNLHTIGTAG